MITQEEVKKLFRYENGKLFWKKARRGRATAGSRAGCTQPSSYRTVMVKGKLYLEHRIVFLYHEGYLPEHDIDHVNGVRNDNRIENLRHATRTCNLQNTCIQKNNTTGFPGVCFHKKKQKFVAQITFQSKDVHLGVYGSPLEAALARFTAEEWDDRWVCNARGELAMAIINEWPGFKKHLKTVEVKK